MAAISHFKNCVDPDQLASNELADQDSHCFHSACKYTLITGILQVWMKTEEGVYYIKISSMIRVSQEDKNVIYP